FSKEIYRHSWDTLDALLQARSIPADVYGRSVAYGQQIAAAILDWVKEDHYARTRSMTRFTPDTASGKWQPTGPDYMDAVEPNWDKIRPLTLSKAHQFTIPEPASMQSAEFKKEVKDVYETSKKMTDDQLALAKFWDCNPYATTTVGHLMYS